MDNDKAISLIQLEKEIVEDYIKFPKQNEFLILNAVARGTNEKFLIDINRKRAILTRCTFQKRIYNNIQLVRLDIDNKPHRNPDGTILEGSHIHIYKEGYNLAWAYSLDDNLLKNINPSFDLNLFNSPSAHDQTFINFCVFCKILKLPLIEASCL